jgi:hypothetical protein
VVEIRERLALNKARVQGCCLGTEEVLDIVIRSALYYQNGCLDPYSTT